MSLLTIILSRLQHHRSTQDCWTYHRVCLEELCALLGSANIDLGKSLDEVLSELIATRRDLLAQGKISIQLLSKLNHLIASLILRHCINKN